MKKQLKRHFPLLALLVLVSVPSQAFADDIEGADALAPAGESELMGSHEADVDSARYRPGKGLEIKSKDELFNLVTRLRLQTLVTYSDADGEDAELGLLLRRARLQFIGNTFGEHNKFKAEFAFSPRDLRMTDFGGGNAVLRESPLLSWYLEFDHLRDLTVRVGQYKIPFSRQRVISSGNLQMVDRAIANGEFNLDRDIGIDLRSKDFLGLGLFRYYAGIYNGEGRSAFSNGDTNLMYLARIEVLPLGIFRDYSEADFERLSRPGVSIGLGYAYTPDARGLAVNRGRAPADGGTTDFHNLTADVTLKYLGFSLASEVFLRSGKRNPGSATDEMGAPIPTEDPRQGYGWFAQAGYLLPRKPIEIAARYGAVRGYGDTSLGDSDELGLAASYYFAHHPLKLQADAFNLWSEDFSDGETRVRVQMQVAF